MKKSSFRELIVWQKSIELVKMTYPLINLLPSEERFALSDQIRRSVISIPSNIAEGQQRNSVKEFVYFLSVAKGSLGELLTQLIICEQLGYLTKEATEPVFDLIYQIQKMIDALMDKISE